MRYTPLLILSLSLAAPALAQDPAPAPPAGAQKAPASDAPSYRAHIAKLEARLPWEGFTVLIRKPFVVVGDEDPARVRARADGTVKWCVDLLKAEYFPSDPNHLIDIWLFKDRRSYTRGVKALTGELPTTTFGFYSPTHRGLFMNIATGGGTLVHEIVHPFISANFPGCPAWFNEGLASLYEQCREREGKIVGLTNWRLTGLQKALESERVPAFAELLGTSWNDFYNRDRGTNYSQARYLCYYLQEKGLLRAFYRRFRETAGVDPTGERALKAVLGTQDLESFQKETWEPFVLSLRFRR